MASVPARAPASNSCASASPSGTTKRASTASIAAAAACGTAPTSPDASARARSKRTIWRKWLASPVASIMAGVEKKRSAKLMDYQTPVFGIDAQGSAGALASPFCSSSIEMFSGDRTNAIVPSRGGRLMVTPAFISFSHVA